MKRSMIYRRWVEDETIEGDFTFRVERAVVGEDDVEDIVVRDQFVQINYADLFRIKDMIPMGQVLFMEVDYSS